MKKKTIIILVIVAAVVFLLWKKGVFSKKETLSTVAVDTGKHDIDAIIAAAGITGSKATLVRKEANYIDSDPEWKVAVEEKAATKGRTYEQELVIDALYAFHYKKADASWKLTKSQFEKCWKAIDAM